MTSRTRAILSILLALVVLWTGLDRAATSLIGIIDRISSGSGDRAVFVIASLIPLGVSVWSFVLAQSARRDAAPDGTDHDLGHVAVVLAAVAVVVSGLATLATLLTSIPAPSFMFRLG